ncbi:MAG: methionine biosynthesis protein MetW [Planctomycetota bacterium]
MSRQLEPALVSWLSDMLARLPTHSGLEHISVPIDRWQDNVIADLIPRRCRVLDLGCGDGQLLQRLMREKQVIAQGIELDPEAVAGCVERQVPVMQHDLDVGLAAMADHSWDVVICEETLQTVARPLELLQDMLRVGRRGIVSFPNFANWRMRLDLFLRGRMPTTQSFPHPWAQSPNIHPMTLSDLLDWTREHRVQLAEGHILADGEIRPLRDDDNLHAEQVLLVLER